MNEQARKYYVDGGTVKIAAQLVYELDDEGRQLRVIQYTDYTAEKVRTLFTSADELHGLWADPLKRGEALAQLEERGINFKTLAEVTGRRDADPFDLLCHVAFEKPLRTRRERAEYLKKNRPDYFDEYGPEAREVMDALLDKYTDFGLEQLSIPDVLQVPPISQRGNVMEIASLFGGAINLKKAVDSMQTFLYTS